MNLPITVEEARRLYTGGDAAHAFDHVLRVYRLARRIGEAEGADMRVLLTAALLHDIARHEPDHHLRGAEAARRLLAGEPPAFVDAVAHCIEAHRFRAGPDPQTLEARILQDADKLDAIGAVGVARAFAHAGHHGHRLWAPLRQVARDPRPEGEDYTPVHEYWYKLRHLADMLHTETARAIARERHAFMDRFFAQFDMECQGEL
ncbi:MAG: HD domain-containing protein [Chloroflexi bacterium]|nr:HD domain-containing protein [Chloroflexota bacterium]